MDTSKAGELRALAQKMRRRAGEMTLDSYRRMMRRAADELDAEARNLETQSRPSQLGRRLDITI